MTYRKDSYRHDIIPLIIDAFPVMTFGTSLACF